MVLVVAGLSVKNLEPRVWDPGSPFYLPTLSAVMVSYAEFHQSRSRRKEAMKKGLRSFLGLPDGVSIYLDNGAFYFASRMKHAPIRGYERFVAKACPTWKPIPQDYIPSPSMSLRKQHGCFQRTMRVNQAYQHNGYVPVVHIGKHLTHYTSCILADKQLSKKRCVALGGIVPHLLRRSKARPYSEVLADLRHVREVFRDKAIHVFGVGGTATLHLISLLGFDSADSSGWRNRAARGIVQLRGSGERLVAELGKWRGRVPSDKEWESLRKCSCPACRKFGLNGLLASKLQGFCCRATHNLWVVLKEGEWVAKHISNGTYVRNYSKRLNNSIYKPIIDELLAGKE